MPNVIKKHIKLVLLFLDRTVFKWVVKWVYPQYKRPSGWQPNISVLIRYAILQKVCRINGQIPWPVDFRSIILGWDRIEKGIMCDPGDNPGLYINASGGLKLGYNVAIAANTVITTVNHDMYDHRKQSPVKGIVIGNNVWIGANCSIVAGVKIGNNVTIGSGVAVRENIPDNSIVVPDASAIRIIRKRPYKWDALSEKVS